MLPYTMFFSQTLKAIQMGLPENYQGENYLLLLDRLMLAGDRYDSHPIDMFSPAEHLDRVVRLVDKLSQPE